MKLSAEYTQRLQSTLTFIVDEFDSTFNGKNSAYMIYKDLHDEICDKNLDAFFKENPDIEEMISKLLRYTITQQAYLEAAVVDKKRIALNILGDRLEELLAPRFTKEKPPKPNKSKIESTRSWFEANGSLDERTDKKTVQSGFITIFFILEAIDAAVSTNTLLKQG